MIKIYNTLTREKEVFQPLEEKSKNVCLRTHRL